MSKEGYLFGNNRPVREPSVRREQPGEYDVLRQALGFASARKKAEQKVQLKLQQQPNQQTDDNEI